MFSGGATHEFRNESHDLHRRQQIRTSRASGLFEVTKNFIRTNFSFDILAMEVEQLR